LKGKRREAPLDDPVIHADVELGTPMRSSCA